MHVARIRGCSQLRSTLQVCQLGIVIALLVTLVVPTPLWAAGMMNFENESDGQRIVSTIPGLEFSSSGDGTWLIGRAQNPDYDIPRYAINGEGFAWLGNSGSEGRIDFVGARGSLFTAGFSTADVLTIEAYDASGGVIAQRTLSANLGSGRLNSVQIEAASPQLIAYVVVRGRPGQWVMDDLEVDVAIEAKPVDTVSTPVHPAQLVVSQRARPVTAASSDTTVNLDITVTNQGRGTARNATAVVPFRREDVTLLDARFGQPTAWVRAVEAERAIIDFGALNRGDIITATLRFAVVRQDISDSPLAPISVQWVDGADGGEVQSNRLPGSNVTNDLSSFPLNADRDDTQGVVTVSSLYAVPLEPVGFWYDAANGRSVPLGTVAADRQGYVRIDIPPGTFPSGTYTIVAQGLWSGLISTTSLTAP